MRSTAHASACRISFCKSSGLPFESDAVDTFILEKQREASLAHSPEADRVTLIRRLSFDLTGLPPSPEDVDRFVSQNRIAIAGFAAARAAELRDGASAYEAERRAQAAWLAERLELERPLT